ncbi:MAG TPA: hypothetical protein VIH57_04640 [Bacteroidales bacterium]
MISERKHIRLRHYDYSSQGWYFVTICTSDRVCYLGKIENKTLFPSVVGKQAEMFWNEIPEHFANVELDIYIVMPNHIHGIIGINAKPHVRTGHGLSLPNTPIDENVGTPHGVSLHGSLPHDIHVPPEYNKFGKTIPGSLSAIIGQFKSALTRWCNTNKHTFGWHGRFYDHVIRNEEEFERIKNYIINNVNNWENDKFYPG